MFKLSFPYIAREMTLCRETGQSRDRAIVTRIKLQRLRKIPDRFGRYVAFKTRVGAGEKKCGLRLDDARLFGFGLPEQVKEYDQKY